MHLRGDASCSILLIPQHGDRHLFALKELGIHELSADWRALLFLLTGTPELWAKARKYLDPKHDVYNWDDMLQERDFGSGFRVLAQLSVALFNGEGDLKVADLWWSLDDRNFDLALRAIRARRC